MEQFKYLGRVLSFDDNDTPAIRRNIKRARQVWGRISKVIAKDSVPAPVAGMFYQAVVAAVLLYGSETWVTPPHELRALEGFHVEAARRITGMRPTKRGETWVYPKSGGYCGGVPRYTPRSSVRALPSRHSRTWVRPTSPRALSAAFP